MRSVHICCKIKTEDKYGKKSWLLKAVTLLFLTRYRGSRQGLMQAWTLTRCSRKSKLIHRTNYGFAMQEKDTTWQLKIARWCLISPSTLKMGIKNCGSRIWTCDLRVMSPTSFQTAPSRDIKLISLKRKADDRTRTDNLLITNQLLCQLSHIGL